MRRYGALSHGHDDHLGHLRPGLARDHRRPAVLRVLVQGQDHRGGVRRRGLAARGCSAAPRCIGAGITAFYMTRLFFMTFHGEKRWAEDVAPARVAAGHDHPDDRARGRLGLPRPDPRPDRHRHDWLAPVVGEPPEDHPVLPVPADHGAHPRARRRRRRCSPGAATAPTSCPRSRPRARRSPAPPGATSTRTPSTRACSCGPAVHLTRVAGLRRHARASTAPSAGWPR